MKERKIIQVVFGPAETEDCFQCLYALCDDGSLWRWAIGAANAEWTRWDNVPQPDAAPDANHTQFTNPAPSATLQTA